MNDFVKVISVQELSKSGLSRLSKTITCLAEIEGLSAHAESIRTRCPECLNPRSAAHNSAHVPPRLWAGATDLRLDFNENTVGCSPRGCSNEFAISEPKTLRAIRNGNRWKSEPPHNSVVRPQELLLTNGVDEAIHLICRDLTSEARDEVLIVVPTFAMC